MKIVLQMNKRELLYEIDKFDEALQTHKYTEELIPVDKYSPYKLDERTLVRSDFESSIYVEDSFLMFYQTFFDKIKLNENAEQVSKSKYFNTLYHDYLKETKQSSETSDPFLKTIERNNKSSSKTQPFVILNFFSNLLQVKQNEIKRELKSKSSPEKTLYKLLDRKSSYESGMEIFGMVEIPMFVIILLVFFVDLINKRNMFEWLIPVTIMIVIPLNLGLLVYWLTHKGEESENKELESLPSDFKYYVNGYSIRLHEDFFSPITFDYLDDFLNDSEVYLYLKEKYNKRERKNGIVNE